MNNPRVCILMSTYNGEKYIREQIESICRQNNVIMKLVIRDDGSTDATLNILEEYKQRYEWIKFIKGKNIGVANSFMTLIYEAPDDYDYYSLADQDDIWKKNKLIAGIEMLENNPRKMLYASNQELIDENGKPLGLRYNKKEHIHTKSIEVLQDNMLAGCTFVFTNSLLKKLKNTRKRPGPDLLRLRIHDVWIINVAALDDGVIYDNSSYMLYRQHSQNVVGAYTSGWKNDICRKTEKIFNRNNRNGRSKLGAELCRCYPEETSGNEILTACIEPKRLKSKMILLSNIVSLKRSRKETGIALSLKIIFNLF